MGILNCSNERDTLSQGEITAKSKNTLKMFKKCNNGVMSFKNLLKND
jgi:hypothetical protein